MPGPHADSPDPAVIARAMFETLVFAPIGLGARFVDDTPKALRRLRQELSNARFIGRLTVEKGAARLSERTAAVAGAGAEVDDAGVDALRAGALPIQGYDDMPAIEIVGRLAALTPGQRAMIAAHESAHRQRRTVLGKIAQLPR